MIRGKSYRLPEPWNLGANLRRPGISSSWRKFAILWTKYSSFVCYLINFWLFHSEVSHSAKWMGYHLNFVRYTSLGTHLFVKVPPQPGDSEVTYSVFDSAANCYYKSNRSKLEVIPLSALFKVTTSELAGLSPH